MGLGYIPVPYIYGALDKSNNGGELAMRVLVLSSLLGIIALVIALFTRKVNVESAVVKVEPEVAIALEPPTVREISDLEMKKEDT